MNGRQEKTNRETGVDETGVDGKEREGGREKVIMHKTQVVSDETDTHQVTICLPQQCAALSP